MDPLEQVLSDLDAAFDSALERQESRAADDLALSLKQDRTFVETLLDGSSALSVVVGGTQSRVVEIAADHLVTEPGPSLVPFTAASVIKSAGGPVPRRTASTLLESLRARSRRGSALLCDVGDSVVEGRLAMCGRDHLVLARSRDQVVIPLSAIRWIRFSPEGLAGGP